MNFNDTLGIHVNGIFITANTWLRFSSLTFTWVFDLMWTGFGTLAHSQKVDSPSLHYSVYVPVWFIHCLCLILIQYLLHHLSFFVYHMTFYSSEFIQSWGFFLALFAHYLFPPSNIHELPHAYCQSDFIRKGFPSSNWFQTDWTKI